MTPAEESLVQAHDLLVVPTLTANLAAKVAHGIGDCLASNVVAEFIMSNKPVVVATNGVCPTRRTNAAGSRRCRRATRRCCAAISPP